MLELVHLPAHTAYAFFNFVLFLSRDQLSTMRLLLYFWHHVLFSARYAIRNILRHIWAWWKTAPLSIADIQWNNSMITWNDLHLSFHFTSFAHILGISVKAIACFMFSIISWTSCSRQFHCDQHCESSVRSIFKNSNSVGKNRETPNSRHFHRCHSYYLENVKALFTSSILVAIFSFVN